MALNERMHLGICDHSHDAPVLFALDVNGFTDRRAARPPFSCRGGADHEDRIASCTVADRKVAAGQQGNAHGLEVVGSHCTELHNLSQVVPVRGIAANIEAAVEG